MLSNQNSLELIDPIAFKLRFFLYVLLSIFGILLTGCSFLSPVKPTIINKYTLDQLPPPIRTLSSKHSSLLVMMPETKSIYSNTRIAYSMFPHQINYFTKNEWAEPPAQMLQTVLVQSLRNTCYFHDVITAPSTIHYDYILNSRLLDLKEIFLHQTRFFVVSMHVQLINSRTNKIVAARTFTVTQTIPPHCHFYMNILAANRAMACILDQITQFIIHNVA